MDSTYRVQLLDSKLVRLCYVWYYCNKSPSGPSSALAALGTLQPLLLNVKCGSTFYVIDSAKRCMLQKKYTFEKIVVIVQWSRKMKNIGGSMHRANSHECLFAFIDSTVKIKGLINCKVIYNRCKHHWTKIREIF